MTSSRLSLLCEKIIEVGWLVALIITPLFFNLDSRRGFEADKLELLRSLATMMAGAWIILQIEARRAPRDWFPHSWRNAFVLPTIVFASVYLLSTLLSIAPRISFLGSYTRLQGAYSTLAYIVVFMVIAQTLRTRAQLDRLISMAILTSVPISLYALMQGAGMDPLFGAAFGGNRASATSGNPIYLGAYLGMVFFLTLAQIFRMWNKRWSSRILFVLYNGIALLQVAAMFATGSRGPFLGWLAGVATFALLYALITQRKNLARGLVGVIGIVGIIILGFAAFPNSPIANLRGTSSISRLLDLSSNPGDSADVRVLTWEGTANLMSPHTPIQFADGTPDALNAVRPLIGYGPETMYLVYARYIPLSLLAQTGYGGDTLVGRSHNETWDVIVNGGLLGLFANQILYCGFLLVGFRALKLITTDRERNYFIALWALLGTVAGIVALLLSPKYLGIAVPAGTMLALAVYLIGCAWRGNTKHLERGTDQVLLATLVAGIVAHYVEVQFGFGVAATNLLLWTFVGLITALSIRTLADEEPVTWLTDVVSYSALVGLILVTLASEFVTNRIEALTAAIILQNSFIFDLARQVPSYNVIGLFLLTWAIALAVVFAGLAHDTRFKSRLEILLGMGLFSVVVLGATIGFAVGRANQLAAIALPILQDIQDLIFLVQYHIGLFDAVVMAMLLLMALTIVMLLIQTNLPTDWSTNQINILIFLLFGTILVITCDAVNLNSVRADVAYNLSQNLNLDYAIALDKYAIDRAPLEDVYYRGLGSALAGRAQLAEETDSNSRFDERTTFDTIWHFAVPQEAPLNRVELFYAARATFLRGRELNPLNPDHTAALAQLYTVWQSLASQDTRAPLANQASQFYAQAISLRPRDANLWNASALLDLNYKQDANAALQKLNESLRLDPRIAQTYFNLGQTYALQKNFTAAIAAYQKYIALVPQASNLWEAHMNIGLVYKQTGNMPAAIREAELAASLASDETRAQLNELIKQWRTQPNVP
jgi:tetratricopeptide (TPR) repeat protein/O-antigen ligase